MPVARGGSKRGQRESHPPVRDLVPNEIFDEVTGHLQ